MDVDVGGFASCEMRWACVGETEVRVSDLPLKLKLFKKIHLNYQNNTRLNKQI